jgi:hypothetical protein
LPQNCGEIQQAHRLQPKVIRGEVGYPGIDEEERGIVTLFVVAHTMRQLFLLGIFRHEPTKRNSENNSDDAHDKERIGEQFNCVHLLLASLVIFL